MAFIILTVFLSSFVIQIIYWKKASSWLRAPCNTVTLSPYIYFCCIGRKFASPHTTWYKSSRLLYYNLGVSKPRFDSPFTTILLCLVDICTYKVEYWYQPRYLTISVKTRVLPCSHRHVELEEHFWWTMLFVELQRLFPRPTDGRNVCSDRRETANRSCRQGLRANMLLPSS